MGAKPLDLWDLEEFSRHQVEWIALQRGIDEGLHVCEKCDAPGYTRFCSKCGTDWFGKECPVRTCGAPASRKDAYCGRCGHHFPMFGEDIYSLEELATRVDGGEMSMEDLTALAPPPDMGHINEITQKADAADGMGASSEQDLAVEALRKRVRHGR